MSDVERITELNHRRAREQELGQRWDEIERKQRKSRSFLKAAETACFSVACILLGGTAVFLGLGLLHAAITVGGASVCCFVGAAMLQ